MSAVTLTDKPPPTPPAHGVVAVEIDPRHLQRSCDQETLVALVAKGWEPFELLTVDRGNGDPTVYLLLRRRPDMRIEVQVPVAGRDPAQAQESAQALAAIERGEVLQRQAYENAVAMRLVLERIDGAIHRGYLVVSAAIAMIVLLVSALASAGLLP